MCFAGAFILIMFFLLTKVVACCQSVCNKTNDTNHVTLVDNGRIHLSINRIL